VSLAYDILDRYLYKEDVQQLARDRGLPTNRPKDELIALLLASGRFVPAEALRYLNKRELRRICLEYLLLDDGDREALFRRVLTAIIAEERPEPAEEEASAEEEDEQADESGDPDEDEKEYLDKEEEPGPATGPEHPRPPTREAPETGPATPEPKLGVSFLRIPPASWPAAIPAVPYTPARDISREHPETAAPWAVASIVAGAIVAAGFYLFISTLGLGQGLAAGLILAVVLAVALLLARDRWVPWLARFGRGPPG
jgi:hypothetical protein